MYGGSVSAEVSWRGQDNSKNSPAENTKAEASGGGGGAWSTGEQEETWQWVWAEGALNVGFFTACHTHDLSHAHS